MILHGSPVSLTLLADLPPALASCFQDVLYCRGSGWRLPVLGSACLTAELSRGTPLLPGPYGDQSHLALVDSVES